MPKPSTSTKEAPAKLTAELGRSGLRQQGGYLQEEFDIDLRGIRGIRIFEEMRRNDPTVALGLRLINWVLGQVQWHVEPGGDTPADEEAAVFVDECRQDMSITWNKFVRDALTCLPFGFSYMEGVYKVRNGGESDPPSRYDDGRIGWRKWNLIGQESLSRWEFDDNGGIRGFVQAGDVVGSRYVADTLIPIEKALLFRLEDEKNNPEGQALTLDTSVPTPDGWKTMGSIQEGDKVYDEQGRIRYVTAKSQVWQQRPCYRVSFSGGTSIIADENHLWSVTTGNDRHRGGNPRIMTTKQIYELGADRRGSLCFGRTPVLDGIKQHVLIPPYILGYWLGDGTRAHSEIAVGNKDVEEVVRLFSEEGYIPAVTDHEHSKRMRPAGLTRQLNTLGLLGNKHIPENYLWADSRQRLALLQGLMDSDGTAHVREHYPLKWVNADPLLIEQMDFLIRSLGGRPCRNVDVADGTVKERPNGYDIIHQKDHTALTFYLEGEAFRLQRKLANQERGCDRSYGHFLKQIEPVEPQDTVCIEVDSPSHLFLAGEAMVPTHNSLLRPIYLAWHIKKNLQEIEAIGIERDLTGVLIIHLPVNATATDKDKAIDLLEQFKADDMAGFTAPQFGPGEHERWRFEIINSPGSKSIDPDKVIQRYQLEIARTFLAQFLLLGQGETGSRAVGMTQRDMFEVALGAILQNLEETINRFMVPPLFRYNDFGQLAALPQIKAGRVSKGDMEKFAAALKNLTDSGLLTANRETEQFLRNEMDLPELPEEEEQPAQEETGQDEKAAREFAEDDDEDEEVPLPDPDDDEAWEQLEKESNKRIKKSGSRRTAAELLRFARPYNYEKKIAEHVEEYKGVMGGLAEQLRSGKITAAKWSYDSKVAITRYTMDGHRLGVARAMGLPVSKVKMTTEQRKVAISAIEEQSKYWSKFAKEVKEQLAAGKPLTPALDARARQYAGSVRSAGAGAVLAEQGDKKLRWVRFAGDSCETCLANGGKVKTAKEWREADVWPSHNVQCHGNCRCSFQEV